MAEILRDWIAKDEELHTVGWLSESSGVGKREIRRILHGGRSFTGTTSEPMFDALMTAIGRYDLYHLLERVEDGRSAANRQRAQAGARQQKFSCAPVPVAV